MSYIETVELNEATGLLKEQYENALKRAGKIFKILKIQSLNPPAMAASIQLYEALMLKQGPLRRTMREALAVVVSCELRCFY